MSPTVTLGGVVRFPPDVELVIDPDGRASAASVIHDVVAQQLELYTARGWGPFTPLETVTFHDAVTTEICMVWRVQAGLPARKELDRILGDPKRH